jgi:hypothetical protein
MFLIITPRWTSFFCGFYALFYLLIKHPCRKQCVDWDCYSVCYNNPHSTVVTGRWFLCSIYTRVHDIQWWEPSHHAMIQISNFREEIISMFYARGHVILCFVGSIKLYTLKSKFMNFKHFKKIKMDHESYIKMSGVQWWKSFLNWCFVEELSQKNRKDWIGLHACRVSVCIRWDGPCQVVSSEMSISWRCPNVFMFMCTGFYALRYKVGVVGGALATCVLLPQGCVSGLAIGLSIVGSYL